MLLFEIEFLSFEEGAETDMVTAPQSAAARPPLRTRAQDPVSDPLESTLTFPPDQSVGYLLRDTHRAFMRILQTRIAADNVTVGMWFFLRALWEEDRRRSLVYLTDKGRSLKERLLGHAIEANRIALDSMTEQEKSELRRLLHVIKRNLEAPGLSKAG